MFTSPATLAFIPTPQAGADAWAAGVGGATTKWSQAIQNTTKDQAQRAVDSQAALVANFMDAVNSGRWAQRLQSVGTQGWKAASAAKAANYGTAATAGKSAYLAAAQQLYAYEGQLQQQVDAMPSGTRADSLARFTTWMDGMIAFKQQYRP